MSDLSDKDKIAIAKHFLISSPPGEFEQVKKDVEQIVDDAELLNGDAFKNVYYEYNVEQFTPVLVDPEDANSRMLIICSYNQVSQDDKTKFRDPIGQTIVTIDHVSGKVVNTEKDTTEFSETQINRRNAIQASVDKYVNENFVENKDNSCHGISSVFADAKDENKYIIVISASKYNAENFWSGRWRSVYQLTYSSDDAMEIMGKMKVNIHNYEHGNALLNSSREVASDLKNVEKDLIGKLTDWEQKFQSYIHNQCDVLLGNLFKKNLRRKLPVAGLFNFANNVSMLQ